MGVPRLPESIQSFFSKAVDGIGGFFRRAGDKTAESRGGLKEQVDKLFAMLPADRRVVLTLAIGIPVILLLFITGVSLMSGNKPVQPQPLPASAVTPRRIPAEDLFLPDEPDFVPGVILEREKRTQWTEDDAVPWWQDPLKNGEQEWRDQIEKTVDAIMESVP
jgi:hypothetical protein